MGLKIKGDNRLLLCLGVIIPPPQMYYSHQSSNFNAEILETPWQDLLFSFPALSQRERKVSKVIKYSIRTRKWNQLDLRLWRENIVFKLRARGGVRGHSLTSPPTVAHMERMLCMQKWSLRLCVCVCMCERAHASVPVGHREMTHCCHSSKNKGFTEPCRKKLN